MPTLQYEVQAGFPAQKIAGIDEVGRGCVAGPVVAAVVILPEKIDFKRSEWLAKVDDSKRVSPDLREELAPLIEEWALDSAIGMATVEEIDHLNIFHASHLAMVRAVQSLKIRPDHLLVDGKFVPKSGLDIPTTAIVKGDHLCLSIGAASIIAKVWRDRYMTSLDRKIPDFGFAQHKGYPTPAHLKALKKFGATAHHRRSFKTIYELGTAE